MFIVVEHHISNQAKFWEAISESANKLSDGLKVHSVLPSIEGNEAVCIWEASDLNSIKSLVENTVGDYSTNNYFPVNSSNAVGLPE